MWLSLIALVLIAAVLFWLVSQNLQENLTNNEVNEGFTTKKEVLFRKCPSGMEPCGTDYCCASGVPPEGTEIPPKCTLNCAGNDWLTMPVCRQSEKGRIVEEGFVPSHSQYMAEVGAPCPVTLAGDMGLPRTNLRLVKPEMNIKLYEGSLIALRGEEQTAFYIRDGHAYLASPPSLVAGSDCDLIRLDLEQWEKLDIPYGTARIQDQPWYLESNLNPLHPYEGELVQRSSSSKKEPYAFIHQGRAYAIWPRDCTAVPDVRQIKSTDEAYPLLPTTTTYPTFPPAHNQSWFSQLLPYCQPTQETLLHY